MTSCSPVEVLERLLHGEMPVAEAAEVRAHAAGCLDCQVQLERLSEHPQLRRWGDVFAGGEARLETAPAALLRNLRLQTPSVTPRVAADSAPTEAGHPGLAIAFDRLGHYQVLGELGRGGMGVVLKAYDPELARVVAVKVLHPGRDDEASRSRFVREARAVAGLNHDHVVAVHAVANPPDGPPYFAMEYVAGPTLRERLQAEKRLDAREAAAICRDVAQGLAGAHQAGLVHRDIKPANIILDAERGRAKILDFGLVRVNESAGDTTQQGTIPGTPEYMSPEQVRSPDRVDVRSDVYNLGVTLYEALTGEVPFRGAPQMVLQQVLHDEPVPPRRLNDRIPRDLETICLKAMAKEPGRRYQTAAELRDDLARWQRGESIRARSVSRGERVWRFCRRKPALAGVSAALIGVVVVGIATALVLLWRAERARGKAEEERGIADGQRRRAEGHQQKAFAVVERMLTRVGEKELAKVPYMDETRRRLLEDAIEFYREFLDENSADPSVRLETARAYAKTARIYHLLGRYDQAERAWQPAIDMEQALAGEFADAPVYRQEWATSLRQRSRLFLETNRVPEAEADYGSAIALQEALLRDHPSRAIQQDMVGSFLDLGILYVRTRRFDEAEALFTKATQMAIELDRSTPGNVEYLALLKRCHDNLAELFRVTARRDKAKREFERSLDISQSLVQMRPDDTDQKAGMIIALNGLGMVNRMMERLDDAEKAYLEAIHVLEEVAADHPNVPEFQMRLAQLYNNLGVMYAAKREPAKSAAAYEKALTLHGDLAGRYKKRTDFAVNYASSAANWARHLQDNGKAAESLDWFGRAIEQLSGVLKSEPKHEFALVNLHNTHFNRALALDKLAPQFPVPWLQQLALAAALRDWRRVVELGEGQQHDNVRQFRPKALAYTGDHRRAMAALGPVVQDAPKPTPAWMLEEFGAVCGLSAAAARHDAALGGTDRERLIAEYAAQALAFLSQAADAGSYRNAGQIEKLRKDRRFEALRDRNDFKALASKLEQRARSN